MVLGWGSVKFGAPVLHRLLEALADPIFVVDADRRLHFANSAADALWGNGCGLFSNGGFVTADDGPLKAGLIDAIAAALAGRSAIPLALALKPRSDGRADVLHLSSLRVHDGDGRNAEGTLLVNCHVRLNCAPALSDGLQFRKAFALSEVEADIALLLASGQSPRRIAQTRDCSEETVRWHIKNLYTKTFAHRLVDLVQQLSAARSPFFVPPILGEPKSAA